MIFYWKVDGYSPFPDQVKSLSSISSLLFDRIRYSTSENPICEFIHLDSHYSLVSIYSLFST